jgi:hypothetical protein
MDANTAISIILLDKAEQASSKLKFMDIDETARKTIRKLSN